MELGANFPAKLEPFLLMSKSAKGAAAAKLIQDATSAPGVFVFAELLDLPNIQELAKSEQHNAFYSLLQLFSYKTFQDYIQHKDALPTLNQAQITKLKHLSIVSLAMERRILPYSDLLQALQMPTIRDLEDLIIDAIYLDILRGKLDQKEQQLEIDTMGRDLEPGKIEEVLAALKNWASTTSAVLSSLDNKLDSLASQGAVNAANNEEHEKAWQYTLKDIMDKQKDGKGGRRTLVGGGGYNSGYGDRGNERVNVREDPMDVDDAVVENKGKNRKASQEAGSKQQKKRNRFW